MDWYCSSADIMEFSRCALRVVECSMDCEWEYASCFVSSIRLCISSFSFSFSRTRRLSRPTSCFACVAAGRGGMP